MGRKSVGMGRRVSEGSLMQRDFTRTIRDLSGRHHAWRVFSDFCEMA